MKIICCVCVRDIYHLMTITANEEVKKKTRNVHNYEMDDPLNLSQLMSLNIMHMKFRGRCSVCMLLIQFTTNGTLTHDKIFISLPSLSYTKGILA